MTIRPRRNIQATIDPDTDGFTIHIWDDEGNARLYHNIEAADEKGAWEKALERFEGELNGDLP